MIKDNNIWLFLVIHILVQIISLRYPEPLIVKDKYMDL